jgi:hypothetical protein
MWTVPEVEKQIHGGSFTRPIDPQQAERLTRSHRERKPVKGGKFTEGFNETVSLKNGSDKRHCPSLPLSRRSF